jgi:hypothetical protein
MSESPTDSAPDPVAPRRAPNWVWVLLSVLLLAIVIGSVLLLIRFGPNTPSYAPTATPDSSPTATPTESLTPVPTPTPTSPVGQGTFDSDMTGVVLEILNSGNTAVFDQGGYFTNPILVIAAASDLNEHQTPTDAVMSMQFLVEGQADNSWAVVTDTDLATYRSGPYGQNFPEGAIVVQSVTGHVISFIGDHRSIITMFISAQPDPLHP